jgi:hypothetical protein
VYPVELDSMFGDPLILEVGSKSNDYLDGSVCYNVLRVFTHSDLLDVFLNFNDYFPVGDPKVIVCVFILDILHLILSMSFSKY